MRDERGRDPGTRRTDFRLGLGYAILGIRERRRASGCLFIPERSAEWLDAVFDDGTTLRIEYVVVESVDEDRPDVIEGDIRVYPNPASDGGSRAARTAAIVVGT